MAIYYMDVQIIGRSSGRSATGAAAYRAGGKVAVGRSRVLSIRRKIAGQERQNR
ncbi:MAG: hypothetical protein LBH79_07385 [Nitrososphaerota archaeon]|nr:hypothetical protein [Nitrososphaerota archaeon]